jgi:predicted helicase
VPFEGLCFVDTLDLETEVPVENNRKLKLIFSEENSKRIKKQQEAEITVIIGNPPYNAHQINENDNNKNRKYPGLEDSLRRTYVKSSKARNKNALWDAYVKFFRWATDRLDDRDGILCFISNNSFVDSYAFDGMRKHLLQEFTRLYHFDLRGNVRKGQREGSVFDIMVSVGITIAVKSKRHRESKLFYYSLPPGLSRNEKLESLTQTEVYKNLKWRELKPDKRQSWILPESVELFSKGMPIGRFDARMKKWTDAKVIFLNYGKGINTARDVIVYDFNIEHLTKRAEQFIEDYNGEVDKLKRAMKAKKVDPEDKLAIDDFVNREKIQWSESLKSNLVRGVYGKLDMSKIRNSLYRPFTKNMLYFDSLLNERRYQFPRILPKHETKNTIIAVSAIGQLPPFSVLVSDGIADVHLTGDSQCFPFYTYNEDGKNRSENITDWALNEFRKQYSDIKIRKWDIFYYIYAMLHHPNYRDTFKDCLKRDLPHIPFAPDFRAFSRAGKKLTDLHLNYEETEEWEWDKGWIETPNTPLSWTVEKMKLSKDKKSLIVNDSLTLSGIPSQVFDYQLGNRSALEWVIDQYRIKTDQRTGIVSDPNNPDDPEYIVRLIGQIIKVSLDTVKIVNKLPKEWHIDYSV